MRKEPGIITPPLLRNTQDAQIAHDNNGGKGIQRREKKIQDRGGEGGRRKNFDCTIRKTEKRGQSDETSASRID